MLKRFTLGFFITLLLSGCSSLRYWQLNAEQQLELLVSEQEYHLALKLIDNEDSTSPLKKQRSQLLKQQRQFIHQSLKQHQTLLQLRQWQQAQQLLDMALSKTPNNKSLLDARDSATQQRQRYIKQQQLTLALKQGPTLKQTQRLLNNILKADPDSSFYQQRYQQTLKQLNYDFQLLKNAATQAASKQQWQQAHTYLQAAKVIKNDKDLHPLASTINKGLKLAAKNQQNLTRNKQQQHIQQLIKDLGTFKTQKNWLQVQAALAILAELKPLTQDHQPLITQTKSELSAHIQTLINQGQHDYTRGRLQQAITSWQQALLLAPGNTDVQQRLQRAQRFKHNIDKLQ